MEIAGKENKFNKDRIFNIFIYIFCVLMIIAIVYPLWFIIIASFSDPKDVSTGAIFLWPKNPTFSGYKELIKDGTIFRGYLNTIMYTAAGTAFQLIINIPAGYALSRAELYGRKYLQYFFIIPMFVSGGLIPTYLNIQRFGLINNPLVLIIPFAVSTYNIIVIKTFFKANIPNSLWEAAQMDGCSIFRYFWQIVLPLSKAIIAVISLWVAVGIWNSWFEAMIYIKNEDYQPLQLFLRRLLIQKESFASAGNYGEELRRKGEMMKYASIVISTLPIMCLYPFLQKYFNQGVMIGSIKE